MTYYTRHSAAPTHARPSRLSAYSGSSASSTVSSCASSYTSVSSMSSASSQGSERPKRTTTLPPKTPFSSMTTSSTPSSTTFQSTTTTAAPAKIPRPPNSFLIYRKERATEYAGLVATELSSRIAIAWREEPPEVRERYANLAKLAKKAHAIKYPDYKFTPIKRGTGKRALALKAMANAARETAAGTAPSPSNNVSTAAQQAHQVRRALSIPSLPNSTTPTNRPRRNAQRSQRFTPSPPTPYSYTCVSSGQRRSMSHRPTSPPPSTASSLFFSPFVSQWARHSADSNIFAPNSPSSSSSSSESSATSNSHGSHAGPDNEDSFSDVDAEGEDDTDCTSQISQDFGQMLGMTSPLPTSSMDEHSMFAPFPFMMPMSMETFEPECLAQHEATWTTGACSSSSISAPILGCSSSSYPYPIPTMAFEDSSLQFSLEMDMPLSSSTFSQGLSATTGALAMLTPLPTPLYQGPRSNISLTAFPFGAPPMVVQSDVMLSPASPSSSTPLNLPPSPAQDPQSYFASALEWL